MSILLTILRLIFLLGALGCAAIAVGAQGGRFNARLDWLTQGTLLWMVTGVACALVAVWLSPANGRWLPLLLGAVTLVSGVVLMGPDLLAQSPSDKTAPSGKTAPGGLKVIQFNVWYQNTDPEKTLAWILAQDADVVVLEEAREKAKPIVAGLRQHYAHHVTCGDTRECGTIIFSHARPVAAAGLQLRDAEGHFPTPAAWARFDSPDGPYTVAGIHTAWPTTPGHLMRRQLDRLNQVLTAMPQDRMILTGDFNLTSWSFTLRRQDREGGLIRRTHGLASFPALKTWPIPFQAPFPVLPIDHVYAGKGWRTVSLTRGPRLGSDHYPVVAVFAPVNPASN